MSKPFNKIKKEIDLSDTLPYGKYLGLTLARVIEDDPRYISWMTLNCRDFFISHKAADVLHQSLGFYEMSRKINKGSYHNKPYHTYEVDYDMEEDIPHILN